MVDISKLDGMSKTDLLNLARSQGLTVHHACKPATIIKAIADSLQPQRPVKHPEEHVSQRPKVVEHHNTAEDVEANLVFLKAKQPRLESRYDGEVFHFSYHNASGKVTMEESGNLNIPLRTIIGIATRISRGPVALMGLNDHFDRLPTAVGQNAYTNTVLR